MGKEFNDSNISHSVRNNDERCDRVVYLHRRESDGIPFYIGIGTADRPYVTTGRNDYWRRVYEKHGRVVEILHENLTWSEACDHEIRLIKEYREKYPEYLVNLTDGGEGTIGLTGESACNFRGHVLFLSLCGKYYFICTGGEDIENAGFNNGNVYGTISGSNNCEYVTSKKIHINGKRIRFKPLRFNDENDIDDSLIANRVEAVVCDDEIVGQAGENHNFFGRTGELSPMFGRTGELSNRFKGYSLGVSKTHFILLSGQKDMQEKGFHASAISYCISGSRPHHKGFKWFRIDKDFDKESLKTLKNLQPFDQDSAERLEELLK